MCNKFSGLIDTLGRVGDWFRGHVPEKKETLLQKRHFISPMKGLQPSKEEYEEEQDSTMERSLMGRNEWKCLNGFGRGGRKLKKM